MGQAAMEATAVTLTLVGLAGGLFLLITALARAVEWAGRGAWRMAVFLTGAMLVFWGALFFIVLFRPESR